MFAQAHQSQVETSSNEFEINVEKIKNSNLFDKTNDTIKNVINLAHSTNEEVEKKIKELEKENSTIPSGLEDKVKAYPIKEIFKEEVKGIKLPAFYKKVNTNSFFETEGTYLPLTKNLLLDGFDLSKEESKIDFTITSSEMASIDLVEGRKDEYIPEYRNVPNSIKEKFVEYIISLPPEGKIAQLAFTLAQQIRKINEIPDKQMIEYIKNALKNLNNEKIAEISRNNFLYSRLVKNKINELTDNYAKKQFSSLLDKGMVICQDSFEFPSKITPKNSIQGISKNLYVEEGEMNGFEKEVINKVANIDNVVFWHRNLERGKGFQLNGFINHYPDFIVKMKNGKIILIETKGDDRDNSDSSKKLNLGKTWAAKAGDNYRYFMVFKNENKLEGSYSVKEMLEILSCMK